MAWIDYKKAYNMVSHSWLLEVMGMMGCREYGRYVEVKYGEVEDFSVGR